MKRNIVLFCFLHLITHIFPSEDELLHLHVVTRNGHRAPLVQFTTESQKDFSKKWPNGKGELTSLGMLQHYTLGQWLRHRYANFLPINYAKSDIFVRSLSAEISIMSAEASMAGLFRPKIKSQLFVSNFRWRPVPIHTSNDDTDALLNGIEICSKVRKFIKKAMQRQEIKKLLNLYNETLFELERYVKGGPFEMMNTWMIYDRFLVHRQENMILPKWASKSMQRMLQTFHIKAVDLFYHYNESVKLGGGVHLNEILHNMKTIATKDSTLDAGNKLIYYAGNDFTITSIFAILKIWDHTFMPPFASALVIELRRNDSGNAFVRLIYRNETKIDAKPHILTIPGCTADCSLETFRDIFKYRIVKPSWFERKCRTKAVMNPHVKVYTIRDVGKPCDRPKIKEHIEKYPNIITNFKMALIFSAFLGASIAIVLIAIFYISRRYIVHKKYVKYLTHSSVDFN